MILEHFDDNATLLMGLPQLGPPSEFADADLRSLVTVGVSLPSRLGPGDGPLVRYSTPNAFECVKQTCAGVHAFLRAIQEDGAFREGLVWNTCHRFEFHGCLADAADAAERECVVARVRSQLFNDEPAGLRVNVLFGINAWRHLLRTLAGLNSGLPGDADVVEQFQTAGRIAAKVGMLGPFMHRLQEQAVTLAYELRRATAWGDYRLGYCLAALSRVFQNESLEPDQCEHVIIGGSSTSRSVLKSLFERFGVRQQRVTLAYRTHGGGQIRRLRRALGDGKRMRVEAYTDAKVVRSIARADVVVLGVSRHEPVIDVRALSGLRDFAERPLLIVDFNTFGSVSNPGALPGVNVWNAKLLDREVAAFADEMCADRRFGRAVAEAERWIDEHPPSLSDADCRGVACAEHPAA